MYAVLVVVVVDGMVFIGVVEACRWVVIVVVLGGWIGVCVGIGWVVVVGEWRCVGGGGGGRRGLVSRARAPAGTVYYGL